MLGRRVIVFGAGNHDLEFVACLTHCLLQLTAQLNIRSALCSSSDISRSLCSRDRMETVDSLFRTFSKAYYHDVLGRAILLTSVIIAIIISLFSLTRRVSYF